MGAILIELKNVSKRYRLSSGGVDALRGVSLGMRDGEFLAVIGSSGSGKSTLMNIVGCLDKPQSGSYMLDGADVIAMSDNQLSRARNRTVGFIFQSFNLLRDMTALENVMLPLAVRGIDWRERRAMAAEALEKVGLGDRMSHRPGRLSGGQQQRVAIARVMACRTPLILADEPTGNLDPASSREIMEMLRRQSEGGVTVLMITHDPSLAAQAPMQAVMEDGRLNVE